MDALRVKSFFSFSRNALSALLVTAKPLRIGVLAVRLVLICGAFTATMLGDEQELTTQSAIPTCEELFLKTERLVRELANVRVVAADRSTSFAAPGVTTETLIRWHNMFLKVHEAQCRIVASRQNRSDWWLAEDSSQVPLTDKTVGEMDGWIHCFRPHGDFLHAEVGRVPSSEKLPYSVLYAAYSSPRAFGTFCLPFLSVGRMWNNPGLKEQERRLLADSLMATDYRTWRVPTRDSSLGRPLLRVIVPNPVHKPIQGVLKNHSGSITAEIVWYAWFSDDEHNFLLRVEDGVHHTYNGMEVPFLFKGMGRHGVVFTADEYTDHGDGLFYPNSGTETIFSATTGHQADADEIVADFLKAGSHSVDLDYFPLTTREWRITELERLPDDTNVWIDPPAGAYLNRVDLGSVQIVGKSAEESAAILKSGGRIDESGLGQVVRHSRSRLLFVTFNVFVLIVFAVLVARKQRSR